MLPNDKKISNNYVIFVITERQKVQKPFYFRSIIYPGLHAIARDSMRTPRLNFEHILCDNIIDSLTMT